jgi:hypothetical protein
MYKARCLIPLQSVALGVAAVSEGGCLRNGGGQRANAIGLTLTGANGRSRMGSACRHQTQPCIHPVTALKVWRLRVVAVFAINARHEQ